jgi:hypothetical protein
MTEGDGARRRRRIASRRSFDFAQDDGRRMKDRKKIEIPFENTQSRLSLRSGNDTRTSSVG